jgi:tetratricopeptide (TPR) repeat protein
LHRYEEAQAALKKGLSIEPSNTDISSRLKEVDALIKKEKAKRAKMNTANLTPCMAAKEEGNALYKDGKFHEAIVVYTRALSLATTDEEKVDLLNNRAACRFQDRDFRQCVNDCSECLAIQPDNVKALLRRGQSYENIEKIELAMADMKRLQELSPGLPQVSQAIHRLTRMAKQKEGHTW